MKRINLTENDIFNIVNRVISEQSSNTKTPEQLIKRFLSGDSTGPGLKDKTFTLKDKRGLNKDLMQFIVKNVEFVDTQSKGTTARVKGIIVGQTQPETEETVFELICGSFGDFKMVKYKGMDGIKVSPPKEEKPSKEEKPKEDLGQYKSPDSIKQKELSLPRNEKSDLTYRRFEYIKEPFQGQTDDIEEYAGTGVLIYITDNERLKNKINTNDEWFNFYDKSGKVKSEVSYYDNTGGPGGQSNLVYLYATEQNSNDGVKELVNTIKSQFVNDLNFYGVKERKKFNLDGITDKSRNVKVYKTQGKDNKNYNIILLVFK
ncbi:hypothetical protein UFOVP117_285 [uncultured Caudovirales phage]|uniref:Uncharacterized protein n=1 Tax=uncultured Caudovirales phage TaxID=2100421 RepID=A0A6J5LBA3_9CAUD|nr:hypothetical protein UFOVP117_285 [uncultured Caudovirales phage]